MENNENRKKYITLSKEEKVSKIKSIKIIYPDFKKAMDYISDCHKSLLKHDEPQSLIITGPSGSGKTTIFKSYIENHNHQFSTESGLKKNILFGEIPSPTKIPQFLESMLNNLGDPFPTRGTVGNKDHRLAKYISDCGVELIMLDEFQHFVHPENNKINYDVADCLKSIINRTNVPVVLFGLDQSLKVLQLNEQLNTRFSMRLSLSQFKLNSKNTQHEIKNILSILDNQLPFVKKSQLDSPKIAKAIYDSSKGLMRPMMKLIRDSAYFALDKGGDNIEIEDLARAYHKHAYIFNGPEYNPFLLLQPPEPIANN